MKKRIVVLLTLVFAVGCGTPATPNVVTLRAGYFPNITHSQAVIGVTDGTFQRALGDNVKLDTKIFNAGPSAIEAMFAGQLDLTYIGPNPAINGYVKSKGEALRIVAGATSGGAVLVVRADAGIVKPADFAGKKIASPQLGNTQDVALRAWLLKQGLKLKEQGGDTQVIPIANPDILTLFVKKEIDGAWVPEPWGARLVREAGGKIFLDERDLWKDGRFVTAHVIVSTKFLKENPELVRRWLAAHVELTQRINADPASARQKLNNEIERLTGKALPPAVLDDAWSRMQVTYDPIRRSLVDSADSAFRAGFLGDTPPDLAGIYDLKILNDILKSNNLQPVE
ncbi:MAG: ABC transporter substrate-binding protein [Chloroflexi bacterium]|nr:ABC transporter substrate-binding protein [Chloroflexota bacterium]